jgi:hypothetical protein
MKISSRIRAAIAVVFVAGCTSSAPTGSQPPLITSSASDRDFVLTIGTQRLTYTANEPIAITGFVTYVGGRPAVDASGSGSGLVGFAIQQLDGKLHMEPAWRADCAKYFFFRGETRPIPFAKSGGTSDAGPDEDFWRKYFAEHEFRLPRGRWRISAVADFWTPDGCVGQRHQFRSAIDITVT